MAEKPDSQKKWLRNPIYRKKKQKKKWLKNPIHKKMAEKPNSHTHKTAEKPDLQKKKKKKTAEKPDLQKKKKMAEKPDLQKKKEKKMTEKLDSHSKKHETLVPFQVISSGCNALVLLQQLLEGPIQVLLCERVNDLRHCLFHLLNCLITTASKFFLELRE